MEIATTVTDLRAVLRGHEGTVGLFPTMGALHDGHLSVVRRARADCDLVTVSIFVNPLQFGPDEDYDAYPREFDADVKQLAAEKVDVIFAPEAGDFVAPEALTSIRVAGLTDVLEGASRPGHFDGVATIVAKLLHAAGPDRAYFSEKDYQQLVVIRRMVADLDMPVEIVACPFVREPDGLALSSRNVYLAAPQRRQALALSASLRRIAGEWDGDADRARARLRDLLGRAPGVRLDYAEIADPRSLKPLHGQVTGGARALVAAFVGPTRLIDNVALPPRDPNRGAAHPSPYA